MGFELARIEIKAPSVGTGIKISLKKMRGALAKMTVIVSAATFREFGWSKGDKIVVQLGTGEHHGLLRLQKNNSKGQVDFDVREAGKGGKYGQLSLGHQAAFVDRAEAARWCQWEKLDGGEIEIVLPKWADETARKPIQRSEPVRPAPASPRPAGGAIVTSSVMGDPAPGRSALDQRNASTSTR